MRILAIGDFHGKFPQKLWKRIKKENYDLILSPGDYCGNEKLAKLFFKYFYRKREELIPEKIIKENDKLEKISLDSGINIIKKIKSLKKDFYGVRGNWDPSPWEFDIGGEEDVHKEFGLNKFNKVFNKKIKLIDFKLISFDNFLIIGGTSSTYPGKLKMSKKRMRTLKELEGEEGLKEDIKRIRKHYEKRERNYKKVFKKAEKLGKGVIFLTHNCPYLTKLDKLKKGPQKGKHFGSYLEKQLIKKYKPSLVICGHMHENQGKQRLGKTWIVNPGAALDGKAALIEIDKDKIKNIKFLK